MKQIYYNLLERIIDFLPRTNQSFYLNSYEVWSIIKQSLNLRICLTVHSKSIYRQKK